MLKQSDLDFLESLAHDKWKAGNLKSAFRLYLSCAEAGNVGCQLNVGTFYADGIGVKPNRDKAIYWYRRAYRQGYGPAASNIGIVYRDESKLRLALAWFERAVRMRDLDANLEIAKIYLHQNNSHRAAHYLRRTVNAKPGGVTEASRDEALALLKRVSGERK